MWMWENRNGGYPYRNMADDGPGVEVGVCIAIDTEPERVLGEVVVVVVGRADENGYCWGEAVGKGG